MSYIKAQELRVGCDKSLSGQENQFVDLITLDPLYGVLIGVLRERSKIPLEGFDADMRVDPGKAKRLLRAIDLTELYRSARLMIEIYDVAERWITTFMGLLLFDYALPPVKDGSEKIVVEMENGEMVIRVNEYVSKTDLLYYIKESDEVAKLIKILPKKFSARNELNERKRLIFLLKSFTDKTYPKITDIINDVLSDPGYESQNREDYHRIIRALNKRVKGRDVVDLLNLVMGIQMPEEIIGND